MAAAPANGWWLVRTGTGDLGVVKGAYPPAGAKYASFIGVADSLAELATKFGAKISGAMGHSGATVAQQTGLLAQLDAGAVENTGSSAAASIMVAPDAKPGANNVVTSRNATGQQVSSKIRSEADPVSLPSFGLGGLGGLAVRVLEAVGAILLLVIGLRALIGGPDPMALIGKLPK